jgi:hypothetical protein
VATTNSKIQMVSVSIPVRYLSPPSGRTSRTA